MTIETILENLAAHEAKSQWRYKDLNAKLEGTTMTDPVSVKNIFEGDPMNSMLPLLAAGIAGNNNGNNGLGGSGLGAGLLGGVLGGALLGGGGLFGGNRFGRDDSLGGVPAQAAADLALMAAIGNLKDTISNATQGVTNQLSEGFAANTTNTLQQTQLLSSIAAVNALATQQALNTVNQNVSEQGSNTRAAVVAGDTATQNLINEVNTANLNRLLTVSDLNHRDATNRGHLEGVKVEVAQTVTQVQAQAQAQQQQQQQLLLLAQIASGFTSLQNAVATNSNLIVGNTGATTTGAQTASPVNVKG